MQTTAILEELTEGFSETVSGGVSRVFRPASVEITPGGNATQNADDKVYPACAKGQGGKAFIRNDLPKGTIIYPDDPSQYPIFVGNK